MLSVSLAVNQDSFEHALEGESQNEKHPINQAHSKKQGQVLSHPGPGDYKKLAITKHLPSPAGGHFKTNAIAKKKSLDLHLTVLTDLEGI